MAHLTVLEFWEKGGPGGFYRVYSCLLGLADVSTTGLGLCFTIRWFSSG